ncbi:MAG: hypothetical protein KKB50_10760 [Planctomycetes bacterium]|nr:hypothetical protein [Planctomycetota bacterium]
MNDDQHSADTAPRPDARPRAGRASFLKRATLYPQTYVWYVFFAALDIMFTWIVLHFEGHEANWLARLVLDLGGLPAMTLYKFVLVMLVICVCEVIGRRRERLGRRLAKWAVALNALPVALAVLQLLLALLAGPNQ